MRLKLTLNLTNTLDLGDEDLQQNILEHYNENFDPDPKPDSFDELTKVDIREAVESLLEDDINFAGFSLVADEVEIEILED